MQTINGGEIKIVPMDSLESLERLVLTAYRDDTTEVEKVELSDRLYNYFVCGYEVFSDTDSIGWSFSTCENDIYTLDGYNNGVSIFIASKMGKMICRDLFDFYDVDVVFSMHNSKSKSLHALVKRIGFRKLQKCTNKTIFILEKKDGS